MSTLPESTITRIERWTYAATIATGVAVASVVAWLSWSTYSGLHDLKQGAEGLASAIQRGDQPGVAEAIDEVDSGANKLHSVAWSVPVRVASDVPYAGRSVRDFQQFSNAGLSGSNALDKIAPSLSANLYHDHTINLAALDQLLTAMPAATKDIDDAVVSLAQVKGDGLGGTMISELRDQGIQTSSAAATASRELAPRRAAVLDALGANGKKNYLVPLLNNAQLRASGGAPLFAAIVMFDHGKVDVPFDGYTKGAAYDKHTPINYTPASPQPWGASPAGLAFVNSNAHPDWRFAGDDLMRAWNASQPTKVDGVLGLDTNGIQSILGVVGPVNVDGTEINEANFEHAVLEDAYTEDRTANEERQSLNDKVGQLVVQKLVGGNTKLIAGSLGALLSDAPGRHFQMYLANKQLEQTVEDMGLAGAVKAGAKEDSVAIFSRNFNMSKVDVYSDRQIQTTVELQADGSAKVRQQLDVTNNAPVKANDAGLGYTTSQSDNEWFFVLPPAAKNAALTVPDNYQKASVHPDGFGRNVLATEGTIAPGSTAQLVAEYTLPAGTFSTDNGLVYSLALNPQAMQTPANLNVTITYPTGMSCTPGPGWTGDSSGATYSGPLAATESLRIDCTA